MKPSVILGTVIRRLNINSRCLNALIQKLVARIFTPWIASFIIYLCSSHNNNLTY